MAPDKQSLKPTEQMSTDQAAIVRVLDAEKSCEPLKVAASRMTPSRTAGLMKWRTDGLLLPFGHPTDGFDMPNPQVLPWCCASPGLVTLTFDFDVAYSSKATVAIHTVQPQSPSQSGLWSFSTSKPAHFKMMYTANCFTTSRHIGPISRRKQTTVHNGWPHFGRYAHVPSSSS